MRNIFFKLSIIIFSISNLSLHADIFYLKNGEKLTGSLTEKDDKFYYLLLKIGKTKILKDKVVKIEKEKHTPSVLDNFERMSKSATSVDEILKTVNFGLKNNLEEKSIILLSRIHQRALDKTAILKIEKIELSLIEKKIKKVKTELKAGNYSNAVDVLNEIKTFNFNLSRYRKEIQQLRENTYKEILSEKDTIELLEKIVNYFPIYQIYSDRNTKTVASKKTVKNKSYKKNQNVIGKDKFYQSILKLDPFFTQIKNKVRTQIEFYEYIKKNNFSYYSNIPVHSKNEIDKSRKIQSEFHLIVSENDKIYKARKSCNRFNYNTDKMKKMIFLLKKNLEKDDLYWSKRGYEKRLGRWVKRKQVSLKPVKIKLYNSLQLKESENKVKLSSEKSVSLEEQLLQRNKDVTEKLQKVLTNKKTKIDKDIKELKIKDISFLDKLIKLRKKIKISDNFLYLILIGLVIFIIRKR